MSEVACDTHLLFVSLFSPVYRHGCVKVCYLDNGFGGQSGSVHGWEAKEESGGSFKD